jgi:hypothetical protein
MTHMKSWLSFSNNPDAELKGNIFNDLFRFLVCLWGSVRLSPFDTSATIWPIYSML